LHGQPYVVALGWTWQGWFFVGAPYVVALGWIPQGWFFVGATLCGCPGLV